MGVYNAGASNMLQDAIESILNQSLQDFEFIICDDASTDLTVDILSSYERETKFIIIRNEKNLGLAASLNKCILISRGKYIARQDADDRSDLNRLKRLVNFMEANPSYDFVGSNLHYFNDDGVWGRYRLPEFPQNKDFLFTVPFIHATVIYKQESIKKIGCYREDKVTRRCEDYDLFMTMYSQGMIGTNIQEFLYYVREDTAAQNRRRYKYRIDEAKVRLAGYKKLHLMPIGYLYAIKPLVIGLIPVKFLQILKDSYYQRRRS